MAGGRGGRFCIQRHIRGQGSSSGALAPKCLYIEPRTAELGLGFHSVQCDEEVSNCAVQPQPVGQTVSKQASSMKARSRRGLSIATKIVFLCCGVVHPIVASQVPMLPPDSFFQSDDLERLRLEELCLNGPGCELCKTSKFSSGSENF